MLGEADRFGRTGACLSWGELGEKGVRPGGVVVPQVLGQHLAPVALVDDQPPVEEFPRMVPMTLSQIAFTLGACGRLARTLTPSAVNTASQEVLADDQRV